MRSIEWAEPSITKLPNIIPENMMFLGIGLNRIIVYQGEKLIISSPFDFLIIHCRISKFPSEPQN